MTGVSLTVALGAPETLTTGASPVVADTLVQTYAVTSGGTGGTETINLPTPDLPLDGFANGDIMERRVTFYLVAQTDPSDVVVIAIDGDTSNWLKLSLPLAGALKYITNSAANIRLTYVGAIVSFIWKGTEWEVDSPADGFNFDDNNSTIGITAPDGYDLQLVNPSGKSILIASLPSADPHINGAIWSNSGVLTISAG